MVVVYYLRDSADRIHRLVRLPITPGSPRDLRLSTRQQGNVTPPRNNDILAMISALMLYSICKLCFYLQILLP